MRFSRLRSSALLVLFAATAAGFGAACGSFGSSDDPASDAGVDAAVGDVDASVVTEAGMPDAALVPDARGDADCVSLVEEHFANLDAFDIDNDGTGIAILSSEPARAKVPPSLAATVTVNGASAKGAGSVVRDVVLADAIKGQSLFLDYDVYLEAPVAAYAEVGCTLELRNLAGDATRLLVALPSTGSIEASIEPFGALLDAGGARAIRARARPRCGVVPRRDTRDGRNSEPRRRRVPARVRSDGQLRSRPHADWLRPRPSRMRNRLRVRQVRSGGRPDGQRLGR